MTRIIMTEKLVGDASIWHRMHMTRIIMTEKLVGDASMGVER
jgi:hypothetical protein